MRAPRTEGGADHRRRVPRTDALLAEERIAAAAELLGRDRVKAAVTAVQQRARDGEIAPDLVVDAVLAALPASSTSLRPVLNATGVLLHTNLGRAPLSAAAVDALAEAAGTTDLELDLATGERGRRGRGALDALATAVPAASAVAASTSAAAPLFTTCTPPAARWWRSGTGSGSRTCWCPPARGCARWVPRTG